MELTGAQAITLPAELGIENAAQLHALLAPHLARREPVVLEVPDVARLHTAALQVLAAFARTRADAGCLTEWHQPAAPLREGAARLGLEALLGLAAGSGHQGV